ncbi:ribose 5-phosphate isomerase B [Coraliomargarita akajimensis]|uniref:Sugar-phosphate isomerase, RpiB/LacA/LacB family n=1 Tax=Coraliomargarita akajimensis (strain DSM 45221 / IAM 15411 / JCM 23193 / KCTC 12865 / 04OKA010-24) TaxID=583355 RepID=D5ERF0_CORAD|nr:ribose 5-phosphate isomerase B [Coraliomargarita akajimensis]ADE55994.1 sugar-phosphate isomerase, RpiB/LacA/LacB family [Coraliomargarita akajimensis DSM 45221]
MSTQTLTVSIGTDHAGFPLKQPIIDFLKSRAIEVLDFGCNTDESCDYPDFIRPAAQAVADGKADCGIVLGGSGNGEAIVANKVRGVRCGLCWDEWSAQMTKEHNNANCISIGARPVSQELALKIVGIWLDAEFEGGRHQRRIEKIEA